MFLAAAAVPLIVPLGRERSFPAPAMLWGRIVESRSGEGELRAGAAKVRIELGPRPVMAGYAGRRRADRPGEEMFARAIALQAGDANAVIASIDALLVPGELEEEVVRRLGKPPCLLLAATHTHSGVGGTWNDLLPELEGNGPFDAAQRDAVAKAVADAIVQARRALRPASAVIARETWGGGPARGRSEGPIDPELVVVRLSGVATLVVYGMHPTSVARDARALDGDWPGKVASAIEQRTGAPALVLQGAGGNATWTRGADLAALVSAEVEKLLAPAAPAQARQLSCRTQIVELPPPQASRRVPAVLRRLAANATATADPRWAVQTRIELGNLALLGVPGEPAGELGLRARPTALVGLADGYVGYVETPEHWNAGVGESAKTYFGPDLAPALGLWSAPR